jgi:hypothetical protein
VEVELDSVEGDVLVGEELLGSLAVGAVAKIILLIEKLEIIKSKNS